MAKKSSGILATIALATVLAFGATPAHALDYEEITGDLSCKTFPNIMIGTESTAKGTDIEHVNVGTTTLRVTVGSSATYASWGWSFPTDHSSKFAVNAHGSNGDILNGSLKRFCTYPFA